MYKPTGFIPSDLKISSWQDLKPFFDKLRDEKITSVQELEKFLIHFSEVMSVYSEQHARAYINMTCYTDNKDYVHRHESFITEIDPEVETASNEIQKKTVASEFFIGLPEVRYKQVKKELKHELEMFRTENVPLESELGKIESEYEQIVGKLMVKFKGEEITLPQASVYLESPNREERKTAWLAIQDCRIVHKKKLDVVFDRMIELRHKIALNTDYKNFRDYQHDDLKRFDYSVQDILTFHDAIEKHVLPLERKISEKHRKELGLEKDYRPWDTQGKSAHEKPLKPYKAPEELLTKAKKIFTTIRPEFGKNLQAMDDNHLFDLKSRKGKAPGGYNYGLEITGMPFIFMNAAGLHQDVITIMHEGGHAMHTFLVNDEPLIAYRHTVSEMAETASMSMELISSKYWHEFYSEEDVLRARRQHLEHVVDVFSWVAVVDAFQHWVYTNPQHTHEERDLAFEKIMSRFGTGLVNWQGYEHYFRNMWQKQLHIFEVPFYYIEYAIAQLGALQIYRNYLKDPKTAVDQYVAGLSLGGSKPISEVWSTMGIKFDFSAGMLKELMEFVKKEWEKLC